MPATIPLVRDVMHGPVRFLSETSTVRDAARLFLGADVSGAPVVNAKGEAVGVLTLKDLLKFALAPELREEFLAPEAPAGFGGKLGDVCVRELMTPRVITVDPLSSRDAALRLMKQRHVRRVFVEDGNGKLVGVVSLTDIAFAKGA